jgi:alpha-L-glutamate ligase-like protein
MKRRRSRPWAWPSQLGAQGVLGINHRNGVCILAENHRSRYRLVDDKLETKRLCEQKGIPVPQTYAVIDRHGDIRRFLEAVGPKKQFVIKPARGAEGRGIIVVVDHDGTRFVAAGGVEYTAPDLRYHLSTILSGVCSLGSQPDRVIIEQRIVRHPQFEHIAVDGTPDIRVVLYRRVPVMAMVRFPTRASRGRANLHQGAIAAAVHLKTGQTFGGVWKTHPMSVHPDTGRSIEGLTIPGWPALLASAMSLADALQLGYLGVDFALDTNLGPLLLEANARPGLAIQLANRRGLLSRLQLIRSRAIETCEYERKLEAIDTLADMP